jgi:hypothetical protein
VLEGAAGGLLEEEFMIIIGLLSSLCLAAGSIGYFVWRDKRIG